jgi:hypothetical protein
LLLCRAGDPSHVVAVLFPNNPESLELVTQTFASWNQMGEWLRRLEALRLSE